MVALGSITDSEYTERYTKKPSNSYTPFEGLESLYLLGLLNEALGNVIFIGCLNAG